MTHPIHDTDDILENLIEAGYQATQNPDCLAGDHSWQPAGDATTESIRCARCLWSPHVRAPRPATEKGTTNDQ